MTEEEANTCFHYFPFIGGRRERDRRFGSKGVSRGLPIPVFSFFSPLWGLGYGYKGFSLAMLHPWMYCSNRIQMRLHSQVLRLRLDLVFHTPPLSPLPPPSTLLASDVLFFFALFVCSVTFARHGAILFVCACNPSFWLRRHEGNLPSV